ncbi:MAG: DUF2007 domain-containing protein [Lysobacter sp.]|nr:DUF2007 domain-containing protein [Lysobacter sp.]
MKVVYEAGNVIDAHLVRHALEHAGIPAFVRGEALLGAIGELPVFGMIAVCVPTVCWPDAQAVLRVLPIAMASPGSSEMAAEVGVPSVVAL